MRFFTSILLGLSVMLGFLSTGCSSSWSIRLTMPHPENRKFVSFSKNTGEKEREILARALEGLTEISEQNSQAVIELTATSRELTGGLIAKKGESYTKTIRYYNPSTRQWEVRYETKRHQFDESSKAMVSFYHLRVYDLNGEKILDKPLKSTEFEPEIIKEILFELYVARITPLVTDINLKDRGLFYHMDKLDKFLAAGLDVNAKVGPDEETMLMHAASQGDLELVKKLVALGADVNAKDIYKNNPLHYVKIIEPKNLKVADYLISKGADVNHYGTRDWSYVRRFKHYYPEGVKDVKAK